MSKAKKIDYRKLEAGEQFRIGDQRQVNGQWETLTEDAFRQWVRSVSQYDPRTMCPFRRAREECPEIEARSMAIITQELERATLAALSTMVDSPKRAKTTPRPKQKPRLRSVLAWFGNRLVATWRYCTTPEFPVRYQREP